MSVKYWDFI